MGRDSAERKEKRKRRDSGNDEEKRKRRDSGSDEDKKSRSRKKDRKEEAGHSHKSHHHSVLSPSSDSSVDNRLAEFRKETHRRKKEEKQRLKALETTAEKHARRLAKKQKKEERRKQKAENLLPEGIEYTDTNNPFNDRNLTSTFVWKKKLQAEGLGNLSMKKIEQMNRERIQRNIAEMEELKRNREAREAAREDLEMMRRDEERRANSNWEVTEESFHLNQARLRSSIRIKEGRAKAIDLIARYMQSSDDSEVKEKKEGEEEFELVDPLTYLRGLKARELEDLREDIKVYRRIDPEINAPWWSDMHTVVCDELRKLTDDVNISNERDAVHGSVHKDVVAIFQGKTHEQLALLETQMKKKMHSGESGTDIAYWESVLAHLHVYMAKARIAAHHREILQRKLVKLKQEQTAELLKHDEVASASTSSGPHIAERKRLNAESKASSSAKSHSNLPVTLDELEAGDEEIQEQKWRLLNEEEMEEITLEMYERFGYSPSYGDEGHAMPGIEILDEVDDLRKRREMTHRQRDDDDPTKNVPASEVEREMENIARRDMGKDEATFAVEAPIEAQTFLWSEKYRPRKPRYFNRVHTGFEWNKYNQTHYDMDNPPPKIVQGYRFNIFYPDLLDVSQTPTFTVTPCDDPDFAVLRFHAGPPYEDIAFKCVNREWEISHKHGYKCQFANGIFQLWFFFKRYRYRR